MTDSIYALIGRNVRHRRLELNMKTQGVADTLEILRSDYLAMEEGRNHIAPSVLFGLTKVLDVRPKAFFQKRDLEPRQKGSAMAKMYEILASFEE